MTNTRATTLFFVGLAALPLLAAETPPDISISREPMDDCTSPIDLTINVTSEVPIDVRALTVHLPSSYVQRDRHPETDVALGNEIDVNPDLDRAYSQHFDGLPWSYGLWPISFHKTLDGFVHLEYRDVKTGATKTLDATFPLPIEAPVSAIFLGGTAGVVIWFLLAWTLKKRLSWRGALAAIGITLLTLACARFTTANFVPLPVSIDLKDSFAGLLIGLAWPTAQKAIVSKVFATLA